MSFEVKFRTLVILQPHGKEDQYYVGVYQYSSEEDQTAWEGDFEVEMADINSRQRSGSGKPLDLFFERDTRIISAVPAPDPQDLAASLASQWDIIPELAALPALIAA